MSDVPAAIQAALDLPEAAYYEEDGALLDERRRRAQEPPFEGLALACPKQLRDVRLPLLVFAALKASRVARLKPYDNQLAVAAPVGGGAVSAGPFVPRRPPAKNPKPRAAGADQGIPPEAETTTLSSLTLSEVSRVLEPPLGARGAVAVRVIEWDQISNTVVAAFPPPEPDVPPEVGYGLSDAERLQRATQADPLRFARTEASPALRGQGLALALPATIAAGGRGAVLRGAVRVVVPARALVDPKPRDRHEEELAARRATLPRAILTGALLLVARDSTAPIRVPLTVPIWSEKTLRAGSVVEGWITLELDAALGAPLAPGELRAWGVLGEHTWGPQAVTVE